MQAWFNYVTFRIKNMSIAHKFCFIQFWKFKIHTIFDFVLQEEKTLLQLTFYIKVLDCNSISIPLQKCGLLVFVSNS